MLFSVCIYAVVTKEGVYILDMAAKIDATADYICKPKWGDVEFPPPFGREAYPEVQFDKRHAIAHKYLESKCSLAQICFVAVFCTGSIHSRS